MLGGRLGHRLSHLSRRLLRIGGGGGSAVAGGCRRGGCRRHLNRRCAHGLLAGSRAGIVRGAQQGRGVGRSALGRLCKEQAAGERQISGGGWRAEAVASGNARNALQTRLPDTFAWLGAAAAPHEHPRQAPRRMQHPDQINRSTPSRLAAGLQRCAGPTSLPALTLRSTAAHCALSTTCYRSNDARAECQALLEPRCMQLPAAPAAAGDGRFEIGPVQQGCHTRSEYKELHWKHTGDWR